MILMISLISSFEINKENPFLALAASFLLVFLSNLFIASEVKLFNNPGKLSLTKVISTFISMFCLNYLNKNQKIHQIELC